MRQYAVDMDITVSKRIYVDAEDEQQARQIVEEKMKHPHYYYSKADAYVSHEITDINPEEPEDSSDPVMKEALDYVREQLAADELAEIRAQVDRSYRYHMNPSDCVTRDTMVMDLLEEYGQENGLPEGWWMEQGDIDDILLKL